MGLYATTNILQTKNKVFRINNLQRQNNWMGINLHSFKSL